MADDQAFPHERRLQRGREIQATLREGLRRRGRGVEVIARLRSEGPSRAGVIAGRMGQGLVRRNRIKRRLREVARRAILPSCEIPVDVVLRALPPAYEASFEELRAEAIRLWEGLREELEEAG